MPNYLIGLLSAADYEHRRAVCRETWVRSRPGIDIVFLVGDPSRSAPERNDDLLWLPCPDDYPSLPQKTRAFCRWACDQYGWDWLLKADDDTWIALDRLASYHPPGEYTGAEWRSGVGYGSGGAGYLLSRRAAQIVAQTLDCPRGAEDRLVADCLRQARPRIPFSKDDRFCPWSTPDGRRPRLDNDLITAHVGGGESKWLQHGERLFLTLAEEFQSNRGYIRGYTNHESAVFGG